eukprot:8182487-Karenia_brevis.AAC.1
MAEMPSWQPLPEQFSFKALLLFSSYSVSMQRQGITLVLAMDVISCVFQPNLRQMWPRPEQQSWVPA